MDKSEKEKIKEKLVQSIQNGFSLLEKQNYDQVNIIRKLNTLGYKVAASPFSKILNNKGGGMQMLTKCLDGIKEILREELSYELNEKDGVFYQKDIANWKSNKVPEYKIEDGNGFKFYSKGRLELWEKAEFIREAKHEVIELGVRLNSFTRYFLSNKKEDYKKYVEELLAKGVNFKLYLLNPDSNIARLYFEDRARVNGFEEEAESPEEIKKIIKRLKKLSEEFEKANYKGKFQVFKYKNIPYNHFLIVDGVKSYGKLLTSHYLFGVLRSQSPVLKIEKSYNQELFEIYWESFKQIRNTSEKI